MRLLHISALLASFVSVIWYRRAQALRNFILKHPASLPRAYVADGNYDSDCTTLRQHAEGPDAEKLQFCEDATFWEHRDAADVIVERPVILSCDAGRTKWNTVMGPLHDPEPKGSLWLYVPEHSLTEGRHKSALPSSISRHRAHPIFLANYPPNHDFHPLGIAIWPSHEGNSSNLFVVNHARERTVIEQFVLNPNKPTEAVHIQTITNPYFLSPNALALTSPTSFYVTNDRLMTRRLPGVLGHILPEIESTLALPLAFVLHVSTSSKSDSTPTVQFVKMFTSFPNGIAVSPSGDEVAIASSPMGEVRIFKRDPVTNALTRKHAVSVPFLADNVHYKKEKDGPPSLIVAGHPNLPNLAKIATGQAGAAASWVVAVVPKIDKDRKPQMVFDSEAPTPATTRVKMDGADWTLKTLFQSGGDEDNGGFTASAAGLVDPDSEVLYVAGLYAGGGVVMCKRQVLRKTEA